MVSVIGRLFRTAGHVVRTRHGVTASAGKGRGDVEVRIISGIRPGAGAWSLTSASPMTGLGQAATCSRTGPCRTLRTWTRLCVLLRSVASYRQQYADNQNISFLHAIVSTSTRMHGEFLRLLVPQANRETEAHFMANGLPSQRNNSDMFRYRRAAFYQDLESQVRLAAAKAAALRIVAPPMHAPSRTSLLHPFTQYPSLAFTRA
jgi:hypothetical protein